MVNLKVSLAYLGYNYQGFAKQINTNNTIEQVLEEHLSTIFSQKIEIFCSGRTDKYVHANEQVINFKVNECKIPLNNLVEMLNKKLIPKNILVNNIEDVDLKFHARFSAKSKTYHYLINVGNFDLKQNDLIYQFNQKLKLNKLRQAAKFFIGTHNFWSFSTSELNEQVRTINFIKITKKNKIVKIAINANGFLRSMVRMIVASMLNYALGLVTSTQITKWLENPEKGKSIHKAPGCGLYLDKVYYE